MHVEAAQRLLAQENAGGFTAAELAASAERVYDKIFQRLAPIIGARAVQALLMRSAKLAAIEFGSLRHIRLAEPTAVSESTASIAACLRELEPAVATAAATRLYTTFLDLIATLIGEQLVSRVLEKAFPESGTGSTDEQETK